MLPSIAWAAAPLLCGCIFDELTVPESTMSVGSMSVGAAVVGTEVGAADGMLVGESVGHADGWAVGSSVGLLVGAAVGRAVGILVAVSFGVGVVGTGVELAFGACVGFAGVRVGSRVLLRLWFAGVEV